MEKEKILRLFQGTKEDQIMACSFLVRGDLDVRSLLKEWREEFSLTTERYYNSINSRQDSDRPAVVFKYSSNIFNKKNSFYYKFPWGDYLLCEDGAIGYCLDNYTKSLEVINHF